MFRNGTVQRIDERNQHHDPLMYVLLFPDGKPGYQLYMRKENERYITPREYYCYQIQDKNRNFQRGIKLILELKPFFNLFQVTHAGKLFQQYCVGAWVKVENDKLRQQKPQFRYENKNLLF